MSTNHWNSSSPQSMIWSQVDDYMNELLIPEDKALEDALQANAEAGLPSYDVTPNQGKFLQLLLQIRVLPGFWRLAH